MPCLNLLRIVVVVISLPCSFGTQTEAQSPNQDTTDSVHVARAIFGKWIAENLYSFRTVVAGGTCSYVVNQSKRLSCPLRFR